MRNIIHLLCLLGLLVTASQSYAVPPYFGVSVEENLSFTNLSCLATAEQILKDDGFEKITLSGNTIFAAYRNSNPYKYKSFIKCLANVGVVMVVVAAPGGAKDKAVSLMQKIKQSYGSKVTAQSHAGCDVWAYVVDKDPKGMNIRQTPKNGKVISRIAKDTGIHIVGAKNGWLKIDFWENGEGVQTKLKKGGWVYGKLVATSIRGYEEGGTNVYMAPSNSSTSNGKFLAEMEVNLLGCQGEWLQVEGKAVDGSTAKGWLEPEEQCPTPFTTCP